MTDLFDWESEDGDPDPHKGDGSPSAFELIERLKAARKDAYSAIHYMNERYGIKGISALVNVIDEEYDTYSDILLERRQVEDYVFEHYDLYVPDLWEDLIDSAHFRAMVLKIRDYTAECVPTLVKAFFESKEEKNEEEEEGQDD